MKSSILFVLFAAVAFVLVGMFIEASATAAQPVDGSLICDANGMCRGIRVTDGNADSDLTPAFGVVVKSLRCPKAGKCEAKSSTTPNPVPAVAPNSHMTAEELMDDVLARAAALELLNRSR